MCPYASRNSSQLIVHLRSHTGDAPFQCHICPSKFKINSDLKRHMRTHTGEKPFGCDLCDYKCAVKGKYYNKYYNFLGNDTEAGELHILMLDLSIQAYLGYCIVPSNYRLLPQDTSMRERVE
jgi:hypothetical protein